ncbi:carbohydrate esterase family 1 protein [Lophiostoma macrostomum CBS 122681]|uniref:Feruloyl esterase C n=1 Tax=Lophiostoma macrostomum CBS 122681 TaxID=1314788 RepID=A0A6A6SZ03_9PLEO|nr:carbohydrate esterase family 1 protein [Lophiostoma macrostomum CBS 122681]
MKFSRWSLFLALILATLLFESGQAASVGCGKTPNLEAGTNTLEVNNKTWKWILTLPNNYNNTNPYRLIFGMHWLRGSFTDVANGGLPPLLNDSAIFVAPNGLKSGNLSGWVNTSGEDIIFVQAVMKAIEVDYCVNEKLRFSTGFSYGGAMSYSTACLLGMDFQAVAALSGSPNISGCAGGTDPVAFYGQYSVSDSVLPILEGRAMRDIFIKNNGCMNQTVPELVKGRKTHVRTVYLGCMLEKPVWFVLFDGDHIPVLSDNGTSSKNTSWTPHSVWKLFSQFH